MRWKIYASNNFPICFSWYKKRGFYLKIDNFASLSISIRIKIIRESIEKGVKKRKKILVVSSVEAGFENDRRKAAEAACQRRRGRRRSPRARKFRPERFVSLVTWRATVSHSNRSITQRLRLDPVERICNWKDGSPPRDFSKRNRGERIKSLSRREWIDRVI